MRSRIIIPGLILLTLISCQKGIENPHSNNPYELIENSELKIKKHAILEINIVPEIPVFTYYPESDKSRTTFTLVITETNGVRGYVKPTFHFWVEGGTGCKSHLYLKTEDFDRFGIISIYCSQVDMLCKPTNMALCLEGFDVGGFQISIRIDLPFIWDDE